MIAGGEQAAVEMTIKSEVRSNSSKSDFGSIEMGRHMRTLLAHEV
jgi:hypothetical protein